MSRHAIRLVFLLPALAAAQPYFNLDFETVVHGRLRGWTLSNAAYEVTIDTSQVVSGNQSMRLRSVNASDTNSGVFVRTLPIELVRGRTIKLSGFIRTEAVSPQWAAVWLRVDGQSGYISLDNMSDFGPRGTTDWTRYQFEREISTEATNVVWGVFLVGKGTAWFDNLQLEIDGVPIPQSDPTGSEPTPEQVEWILQNGIPLKTADAGSGFDDLHPLKELVGNARIVGLGEATHGTSEFFRMKHRILEFLASEMGFTLFMIEANMPEAYFVNDYVLTGRGDPKGLLQVMNYWMWNTREVLDMIEWMREFNASGRGRIQFTGFDMVYSNVAGFTVRDFVTRADPQFLPAVNDAYRLVSDAARTNRNHEAAAQAAKEVRETLEARFDGYLERFTPADADWALQNARIVEQAAYAPIGGALYRDEMMARNTIWILEHNPDAKAVLWAHNSHVSRSPRAQGALLADKYSDSYLALGFAFNEGRYNARDPETGRFGTADASLSYPGSAEFIFHATGMPQFILDLRKASPDNAGAWLLGEIDFRTIGWAFADGFATRPSLSKIYDALVFFDKTTPSAQLPF